VRVEKISAVTFRVLSMKASVHFYCDVLGMELVYGGEERASLRFVPKTRILPFLTWSKVTR
jgi:catechol 2,3-dioxygenase-like lactoylglutathione lyase family enzyme